MHGRSCSTRSIASPSLHWLAIFFENPLIRWVNRRIDIRIVRFVRSQRSERARPGPAAHGGPSNWRSPSSPGYRACRLKRTVGRSRTRSTARMRTASARGGGNGAWRARRRYGRVRPCAADIRTRWRSRFTSRDCGDAEDGRRGPARSNVFVHFLHQAVHFCTGLFLAPGGIMLVHAYQQKDPSEASAYCRRRCSARQHSSLADGRPVDRNAGGAGREAQEDQQASGASRRTHGNHQTKTHLIESFHTNDSRPLEQA
jgi:hypothetical protein